MALSSYTIQVSRQGRELFRHGTDAFPVGCYHDDLLEVPSPWHWHDEMEAGIVVSGKADFYAGEAHQVLHTGDGFFINAGILHQIQPAGKGESRLHSVVFHPRLVGGGMDSVFWEAWLQPLMASTCAGSCILRPRLGRQSDQPDDLPDIREDQLPQERIRNVRDLFLLSDRLHDEPSSGHWQTDALDMIESAWQLVVKEPPEYAFLTRAALSHLVCLLFTHMNVGTGNPLPAKTIRNSERIKQMLEFIQNHFSESLTVASIAGYASISESECLRCFRQTIGMTPIQYLTQFRMQEAARLLISTDNKITDVGISCGFHDTSYFVKKFREIMQCTPNQYRKLHRL